MSFVVGQTVIIEVDFTDENGTPTNPTTVVLTVRDPSGNTSTPTHTNPATGHYEAVVTLDEAGVWRWRWTGTTSGVTAVVEDRVCAERSLVVA